MSLKWKWEQMALPTLPIVLVSLEDGKVMDVRIVEREFLDAVLTAQQMEEQEEENVWERKHYPSFLQS